MSFLHEIAPPSVELTDLDPQDGLSLFDQLQEAGPSKDIPEYLKHLGSFFTSRNTEDVFDSARSLVDTSCYPEEQDTQTKHIRGLRQGWQRPGPGAPSGSGRNISHTSLYTVLLVCLSKLTQQCLERCTSFCNAEAEQMPKCFDPELTLTVLSDWMSSIPSYTKQKKKIWVLDYQLGIPAFLLKIDGALPALVVHQTICSMCGDSCQSCSHREDYKESLQAVSQAISLSPTELETILEAYCKSRHFESPVCFYGNSSGPLFSVVQDLRAENAVDIEKPSSPVVVKRAVKSGSWICLSRDCLAGGIVISCSHVIETRAALSGLRNGNGIKRKAEVIFSIADNEEVRQASLSRVNESRASPAPDNHRVALVPSEEAVLLDLELTKSCLLGHIPLLENTKCSCGWILTEPITEAQFNDVRIECDRVSLDCRVKIWKCKQCHKTHRQGNRQVGLIWISAFTGFTEVALFRAVLQMVFGGISMSSIAEARAELFRLSSIGSRSRSEQCFRKGINLYANLVTRELPSWLFRCLSCSEEDEDGEVYYRELAFDGLQVGFRKSKRDQDEIEVASNKLRAPIIRNPNAAAEAYLVRGRGRRSIILEAMRARPAPTEINSVQYLCSNVFTLKIKTKEMVQSALDTIKLFDKEGWHHANSMIDSPDNTESTSGEVILERLFTSVIDCTRVARVLAIILIGLNSDLLKSLDEQDRIVLLNYAVLAKESLQGWIARLANKGTRNAEDNEEMAERNCGIAEHVSRMHGSKENFKGRRTRLQWINDVQDIDASDQCTPPEGNSNEISAEDCLDRVQSQIRKSGTKRAGYEATVKILMLVSACLNEPACVWMRDGSFDGIFAVANALQNVGTSGLHALHNTLLSSAAALDCPLLCEGIIAVSGSIRGGSDEMCSALADLLLLIPTQHETYVQMMYHEYPKTNLKGLLSSSEYDRKWFWNPEDGINRSLSKNVHTGAWQGDTWAPDFPQVRPSPSELRQVDTSSEKDVDLSDCIKRYAGRKAFTPGTFVVNCLCSHAKCLAVISLRKPEGCRTPLNFIMERTKRLPDIVIYDYACGTLASALGISPFVVQSTSFLIDRFHFMTHKTCSLAMHPDSHFRLRGRNTSSQEQRNSRIRPLQFSLREMTEEGFKDLTVLAHALHNGKAMYRDYLKQAGDITRQTSGWTAWLRAELPSVL